jgi:hypothetical protein
MGSQRIRVCQRMAAFNDLNTEYFFKLAPFRHETRGTGNSV